MPNDLPTVSIVIATYNSSRLLPRTLDALIYQTYPRDYMEFLIIDGGSTDNTREIAAHYNCTVINNPYKDPVSAKLIGYNASNGKYVMVLDHDEVLVNPNSISIRIKALIDHPECKVALCSGYKRPANYPGLNQYISEFGDPFSLFVYHCSKDYKRTKNTLCRSGRLIYPPRVPGKKQNIDSNYDIVRITSPNRMLLELCCVATIIDKEFFEQETGFLEDKNEMVHLFYTMCKIGATDIIISRDDPLEHYSADSIPAYLPKLRWRIINNVHLSARADQGFSGRDKSILMQIKTYFFPIYALSIVFPTIDAIILSMSRRNASYMLHPFLSLYVALNILWQYMLKILRKTPVQRTYDGKAIE